MDHVHPFIRFSASSFRRRFIHLCINWLSSVYYPVLATVSILVPIIDLHHRMVMHPSVITAASSLFMAQVIRRCQLSISWPFSLNLNRFVFAAQIGLGLINKTIQRCQLSIQLQFNWFLFGTFNSEFGLFAAWPGVAIKTINNGDITADSQQIWWILMLYQLIWQRCRISTWISIIDAHRRYLIDSRPVSFVLIGCMNIIEIGGTVGVILLSCVSNHRFMSSIFDR